MNSYSFAVSHDVTLTTLGRESNENIILCPGDDYRLAFQCVVKHSSNFQWSLKPLFTQLQFGPSNVVGKRIESQVTLVLTEKDVTSELYESQLLVSTNTLIELLRTNNELEVSCETSTQSKSIFIRISGKAAITYSIVIYLQSKNSRGSLMMICLLVAADYTINDFVAKGCTCTDTFTSVLVCVSMQWKSVIHLKDTWLNG